MIILFLAEKPIILQNEVLLYAILTKTLCILEEVLDLILTGYLSVQNTSSYASQHAPLLGAVPRRNLDDYSYPQSSSNTGYGVSLPPGRDYSTEKGILSAASLAYCLTCSI